MKTLSHLRPFAAALAVAGAAIAMSSCSTYPSPAAASAKAIASQGVVFSYNDQANPAGRLCEEVGPLPARAQRAMASWLERSELKQVSYAYPQYFVEMIDAKSGRPTVWGLITDGRGNLTGIHIPAKGRPAWEIPTTADIEVYVCQGSYRDSLSRSIMNALADEGYDELRLNARRSRGLTEDRYLISKPAPAVAAAAPVTTATIPAAAAASTEEAAPVAEEEETPADDSAELEDDSDDFDADSDADSDELELEDDSDDFGL